MTKLSSTLGSANLLLVQIEDAPPTSGADASHGRPSHSQAALEELHAFLLGTHKVCGREFAFLLHKVEHQREQSKLVLVSIGSSVVCAGTADSAHWSCAGASKHSWATAADARALLADFEVLPVPKMAKRMQLLLSPTTRCLTSLTLHTVRGAGSAGAGSCHLERLRAPPEETAVQIIEVDDLYSDARDEGLRSEAGSQVMTDGAGRISLDLARLLPPLENGSLVDELMASRMARDASAPLVCQARLWYAGSAAKGLWLTDATLPERTILVGRQTQRKLDGREACVAARCGTSSLEVIRTFERPKRVRLDVYLIPLLEVAAGARKAELHALILSLQRQQASKHLAMNSGELSRAMRRQRIVEVIEENELRRAGAAVSRLMQAGFDPLGEPYLQLEIAKLRDDALRSLKAGTHRSWQTRLKRHAATPMGSVAC